MSSDLLTHLRYSLAVLGIFILLGAAPPADLAAESKKALERGIGLLQEGQHKKALAELEKANELAGGRCGPCLVGISRAHIAARQWSRAAAAARNAIAVLQDPEHLALAYNQLGVSLVGPEKKDWEGAEEAFRKSVELAADKIPISRYNLAEALMARKRYAEAAEAARAYLVGFPQGGAVRLARTIVCEARLNGGLPPPPASSEPMQMEVLEGKVSRPQKIGGPAPAYTQKARMEGAAGVVILESVIDEDGCVQNLHLLKGSHPDLDNAAMEAVRRWVFQPATFEGRPVQVFYSLTVTFRADSKSP